MNTPPTRRQIDEMTAYQAQQKAAASTKPDEQAAFEDWLYRVCPSGDVDTVNDLWKTSADHEDFLFDLDEWEAANQPAPSAGTCITPSQGAEDES